MLISNSNTLQALLGYHSLGSGTPLRLPRKSTDRCVAEQSWYGSCVADTEQTGVKRRSTEYELSATCSSISKTGKTSSRAAFRGVAMVPPNSNMVAKLIMQKHTKQTELTVHVLT